MFDESWHILQLNSTNHTCFRILAAPWLDLSYPWPRWSPATPSWASWPASCCRCCCSCYPASSGWHRDRRGFPEFRAVFPAAWRRRTTSRAAAEEAERLQFGGTCRRCRWATRARLSRPSCKERGKLKSGSMRLSVTLYPCFRGVGGKGMTERHTYSLRPVSRRWVLSVCLSLMFPSILLL